MLRPRSARRALTLTAIATFPLLVPTGVARAQETRALPPLTFTGEVRTRSELDHPGGAQRGDLFTFLRTRLGVRVDPSPNVRILLQAQDSRVLGAEGHPSAASVESFGVHQGYLELRAPWHGANASLRVGRQEIAIGNERLVGAVGWSNTGRSFDGARVTIARAGPAPAADSWSATLFAATVEERGRHFGAPRDSGNTRDHVLAGVSATAVLGARGTIDATAIYDGGGRYRSFTSADRATVDLRWRAPVVARVSLELEGAWQHGVQHDTLAAGAPSQSQSQSPTHSQRVRAWMAGARVTTAPLGARRLTLGAGVDALSGDATPHDGEYTAFSTMYGSNHAFYGNMDVIGEPAAATRERGLVDQFATSTAALSDRVALRAELHRFVLASGHARDLGWEGDVVVPVRLLPTATLDLGYSVFRAGADAAPFSLGSKGATRDWMFVQLRVAF